MILPLSDITAKLKEYEPAVLKKRCNQLDGRAGTDRSFVSLSGVRLFQSDCTEYLTDVMYVCFSSRINVMRPGRGKLCHLMVIEDEPLADSDKICGCVSETLIVLRRPDTDPADVFACLRTLTRYVCDSSLILEQLLDALQQTGELNHVTDLFARMMGNRVIILDTGFRILAWGMPDTVRGAGTEKADRRESEGIRYDSEIIAHYFRSSGRLKRISERFGPVYYPWNETVNRKEISGEFFEETVFGCIDCVININGVPVGYIALEGICQPVTAADVSMISIFSRLVALELQKDRFYEQNSAQQYSSLLKDMLEGRITEREEIERRLSVLGYRLPDKMIMIVAGQEQESANASHVLQSEGAQAEMRSYFPWCMSVFLEGRLVLLAAAEDGAELIEDSMPVSRDFHDRLIGEKLVAGISASFCRVEDIALYYIQATAAFESVMRRRIISRSASGEAEEEKRMMLYCECGFEHLLEVGRRRAEIIPEDMCMPQIVHMYKSSDENVKELLKTLKVYMYNHNDTDETARRLCVHRNTLYYRLGRLRRIFGDGFTQGETAFRILFSLKIMETIL